MAFLIGLLTFLLVLDCVALILLVLIQLPKKEAGAGVAFGGAATDTLFGAGTGNVLTKATKYAAGIFFVLAVLIGVLQNRAHTRSTTDLEMAVENQAATPATQTVEIPPPDQVAITNTALNSVLTSSATSAVPTEPTEPSSTATNAPGAE